MNKLIFIVLIFFASKIKAQNFVDLANIYWRCSPLNNSTVSTEAVLFNTFSIDAKAPVKLNDSLIFIPGFEIANNQINTSNDNFSFSNTTLQLGIEKKWNTNFKTLLMLTPKFSSTFTGGLDSKDFQFGGVLLNTIKRNKKFEWLFGAYVNTELFSVMIVPLFGFNWQINDKWRLKTIIPVNLELSNAINKKWRAGFLFIGANASYSMRQQINPFTTYPNNYQPYMDKADNNAWFFSDIYLTKNLVLHLKAGYSVLRKYRIYDSSDKMKLKLGPVNIGDDRNEVPVLMKNGLSFEARLIFRLPLPN